MEKYFWIMWKVLKYNYFTSVFTWEELGNIPEAEPNHTFVDSSEKVLINTFWIMWKV